MKKVQQRRSKSTAKDVPNENPTISNIKNHTINITRKELPKGNAFFAKERKRILSTRTSNADNVKNNTDKQNGDCLEYDLHDSAEACGQSDVYNSILGQAVIPSKSVSNTIQYKTLKSKQISTNELPANESGILLSDLAKNSLLESNCVQTSLISTSDNLTSDVFDNASALFDKLVNDGKNDIKADLKRSAIFCEQRHEAKRMRPGSMIRSIENSDMNNSNMKYDDSDDKCPIATLLNIGNTCFLNSIIYTLRFTPYFLHNLHHLREELLKLQHYLASDKTRTSQTITGHNRKGWINNRNLSSSFSVSGEKFSNAIISNGYNNHQQYQPSSANTNIVMNSSSKQIAVERLHELYCSLHENEDNEIRRALNTECFLKSVQEVNHIFDGNQQQDAHEFLMCVLEILRDTCHFLSTQEIAPPEIFNETVKEKFQEQTNPITQNSSKFIFTRKSLMKKAGKTLKNAISERNDKSEEETKHPSRKIGHDFITENFQGVTVSRTKCLVCEQVTERSETMLDIPVPILDEEQFNPDDIDAMERVFERACVTKEYLIGQNKYFCSNCQRYCEARRTTSYSLLPRLLVLQMKRFSGCSEKICHAMPTPFSFPCFCDRCLQLGEIGVVKREHHYSLYSVILHIGATMSNGHYVSYVRALDLSTDYKECTQKKINEQKYHTLPNGSVTTANGNNITTAPNSSTFRKIFGLSDTTNSTEPKISSTIAEDASKNSTSSCPGLACCSIKFSRETKSSNVSNIIKSSSVKSGASSNNLNSSEIKMIGANSNAVGNGDEYVHRLDFQRTKSLSNGATNSNSESEIDLSQIWFVCDDDRVRQISSMEFLNQLSVEENDDTNSRRTSTPYLLFYVKNFTV